MDLATGARRLELEIKNVQGEAEGLHVTSLLGGTLHFLVAPLAQKPTFGPTVGLLHFTPSGGSGLRVSATATRRGAHRPRVRVRVTRRGAPVEGAKVSIAGARARTNASGRRHALARAGYGGPLRGGGEQGRPRGPLALPRARSRAGSGPCRPSSVPLR